MSINGKKIAILIDDCFEEEELAAPLQSLKDNQAEVSIVSAENNTITSMNDNEVGKKFSADLLLDEASSKDYDALILPGGIFNADRLRMKDKAQAWAIDFIDDHKLVAVSSYSPLLLISADLVEEKKLTSSPTIKDDVCNAGGEWTNRAVVVDNNLITSRSVKDIDKFIDAVIEWFDK